MTELKLTPKEAESIEEVKSAIKKLPRSIHLSTDDYEGIIEFWKKTGPGTAKGVTKPLRCKRALTI